MKISTGSKQLDSILGGYIYHRRDKTKTYGSQRVPEHECQRSIKYVADCVESGLLSLRFTVNLVSVRNICVLNGRILRYSRVRKDTALAYHVCYCAGRQLYGLETSTIADLCY